MELQEDEPAEELDADDNDDIDDGVCFSKLEAAELETDDEPDEFCPHDLSGNILPLNICLLTCGYRIRIWSTTSRRFLASIAST